METRTARAKNGRIRRINREEGRRLFNRLARRYMGMSGSEFIRKWDAGEFKDPDRPDIMQVAMLLPLSR